jgi:hypothetical protein
VRRGDAARRRLLAVGVLVAAVALLPGCLRADYGYQLRADGSGVVELELRFADELVRTLDQIGLEDLTTGDLGIVEQQLDRLPEDWQERIDVESLDDGSGVAVRIEVDDLTQLDELRQLGEIGIPTVTRRDDTWRVEVDFSDLVGAADALAPTADELTAGDLGSLLSEALGAIAGEPEVLVRITMPGPVTAADERARVDGDTVVWTVDSGSSGVGFVESGTSPVGFLSTSIGGAPAWGLGLLALVVVGALIAVVVVRRRRRPAAPPSSGSAPWNATAAGRTATGTSGGPTGFAGSDSVPPGGGAPLGGWAPTGGSAPVGPHTTSTLAVPEAVTAPVVVPVVHPAADPVTEALAPVQPPGWHPDPWGEASWRWWDGSAWSHHTA